MKCCVETDLDSDKDNISQSNEELEQTPFKERSFFKKALFWICGIEKNLKKIDTNVKTEKHDVDTSIDEKLRQASICDLNVIIVIAIAGFFYGFFNKYD